MTPLGTGRHACRIAPKGNVVTGESQILWRRGQAAGVQGEPDGATAEIVRAWVIAIPHLHHSRFARQAERARSVDSHQQIELAPTIGALKMITKRGLLRSAALAA